MYVAAQWVSVELGDMHEPGSICRLRSWLVRRCMTGKELELDQEPTEVV